MVVVSVLVALGMKVGDAIDLVRATRPGTIRNPAQIFYVKMFAQIWHQHNAAGPLRGNPVARATGGENEASEVGEDQKDAAQETRERRRTKKEGSRKDLLKGKMLASFRWRDKADHH